MITYELAKKLRESGFPIHEYEGGDFNMFGYCIKCLKKEGYCEPSLSELIEACGDETVILKYFTSKIGDGKRIANAECKGFCETGSTLGEAVTNLWLALNNK